jgi:hypothetical protein
MKCRQKKSGALKKNETNERPIQKENLLMYIAVLIIF